MQPLRDSLRGPRKDCAARASSLLDGYSLLATLKKKVGRYQTLNMTDRLVNYVRARRRKAGLSQRDLAFILGYGKASAVSRHELFRSIPPLIMALAYEVLFHTPIAELFPGLYETVEDAIGKQITQLEARLLRKKPQQHVRSSREIDRKLEWLAEWRRSRTTKQ